MQQVENVIPAVLTRRHDMTLRELADSYMACYQGRDGSIAQRVRYFVDTLGDKLASEIDSDDAQDALDALVRRGALHNRGGQAKGGDLTSTGRPLAPATINRYRVTLQGMLTWARKKRLMPKGWVNPANDTERLPEDNARTRYLSNGEYDRLLKAARVSYWSKLPLIIQMAVTTGARKGTLLGLRWLDIDLDAGRAYAERTKNGSAFTLALLPQVVEELRRVKGKSDPDELVFCGRHPDRPMNFDKAWKNALANASIEGACFHSLRHTHASWLAQSGAPLLAIADSLGHKSLAMTKRYSHMCVDSRAEMLSRVFGG